MSYSYTARDKEGNLVNGQSETTSEAELSLELKKEGLLLTSIENQSSEKSFKGLIEKMRTIGTVPLEEKMFFTQNLQVMLKSGISLSVGLQTLGQQTENLKFKKIILDIRENVEKGNSFAASIEKHQKIFGELFASMIAAGETSGQLETTLVQLRTQMKKDHDLISKVRGAMMYPSVVIIAMIGVMITVVTFVIPKITDLFTEAKIDLPLPTRVLIAVSNFMVDHGILLGIFVVIAIISFIKFIKINSGKKIWHKFMLKAPIMSPIIKKINLARFARTLSSLLKTDIPIVESFAITSKTMGNYHYRVVVDAAAEDLKKGNSITSTLKANEELFPPLITQMISVGEESGSLDDILDNLAQFYEETVTETMANFSSIIEPVLILLLGLGVGAVAVAVIMPMYALTQAV